MINEQSNVDEIEKKNKIFYWKCNTSNCGNSLNLKILNHPELLNLVYDYVRQCVVTVRHMWILKYQFLPEEIKQKS